MTTPKKYHNQIRIPFDLVDTKAKMDELYADSTPSYLLNQAAPKRSSLLTKITLSTAATSIIIGLLLIF